MNLRGLWRLLVGRPLPTSRMAHERLTNAKALAVFSSDALSSSAYATEEVLRVLVLAGGAGLALTLPISATIVCLLAIVAMSYFQTIHAYPNGGGAYIVSKDNLGPGPALVAASALLIDYVLTVAVSISAGVAAITSAVPLLHEHRLALALAFVAFITVMNLRGVRESGTVFAVPTYLFLFSFGGMIAWGMVRLMIGHFPAVHTVAAPPATHALTLLLVMRAFSSGCAALTGVEAVSNGIPAFRPPESRNARIVMVTMAVLLSTLFFSVSVLARHLAILPVAEETVVSQAARRILGTSPAYYLVQVSTTLILILAANTAFADFPRLAALVGRDGYLPRQLANLGDRLVFSNGIALLGGTAAIILTLFHAETHSLIPLYMVGVFISFTLSQAGMVRHWRRVRERGWRVYQAINGFGAVATAVVGLVVGIAKFGEGAWITLLVITALGLWMRGVRRHYDSVADQLRLTVAPTLIKRFPRHRIILPVQSVHNGVLNALRYAMTLGDDVVGLHIEIHEGSGKKLQADWEKWAGEVPLVILPSPLRTVIWPLVRYTERQFAQTAEGELVVTLIVPEFVPRRAWHHFLHNQTALMLRLAFTHLPRARRHVQVIAAVPFYLQD